MRTSTVPITPLGGCSYFQNEKDSAAIRIRKSPREEIHETPVDETSVWSEPSGFEFEYGVKPSNCDQLKRCSPIYQAGGVMKKPVRIASLSLMARAGSPVVVELVPVTATESPSPGPDW